MYKLFLAIGVLVAAVMAFFYGYRMLRHNGGAAHFAVHPALAPSLVSQCDLRISSFPAVGESARDAWIGDRLGADKAADVAEGSSEQIFIDGNPAVRWVGTVNGAQRISIFAFASDHTYEITPSVTEGSDNSDGVGACGNVLSALFGGGAGSPSGRPQAFNGDGSGGMIAAATASDGSAFGAAIASASSTATSSDLGGGSNGDEVDCL